MLKGGLSQCTANAWLLVAAYGVVFGAGMVAGDTQELAAIMKLARNEEGCFMEAHVKLRPVDMATDGRRHQFPCNAAGRTSR